MVLHLLGKKSWNVYNADNVDRVRRDEANAKLREEAEEAQMQEEDAARRLAILRGEAPPALSSSAELVRDQGGSEGRLGGDGLPRKRRRLRGEDDTDRDIRFAKEDAEAGEKARSALGKREPDDGPLHDHAGHIQLIAAPDEKAIRKTQKNAEAEAEKAKKRKREEDQYTMRFSNAAGFQNGMEKPWYAAATSRNTTAPDRAVVLPGVQEKDVWGNEDPLRRERERSRISTNDPFAAMQQAQRQLKQSEADRERWKQKRLAELDDVKRAEERKQRRERKYRRRHEDGESLDGFSLDASSESRHRRSDHDRSHKRHHRRHRSRSRSREKHKYSGSHS